MTPSAIASIAFDGVVTVLAIWFVVALMVQQRRVKQENARRQAEYEAECITRRASGQPPPWPPNRVRLG